MARIRQVDKGYVDNCATNAETSTRCHAYLRGYRLIRTSCHPLQQGEPAVDRESVQQDDAHGLNPEFEETRDLLDAQARE